MDITLDTIERSISRSGSNGLRLRSGSKGSSSSRNSRHSFSFSGIPGPIHVFETKEDGEEISNKTPTEIEKRQNVSLMRLAYLNKPEIPVLIIGSIGAGVHGVIFPVFSLLLSSSINMFFKPPEKLKEDSKFWALVYLGLGFIALVAIPFQNYFFGVAGGKLIQRIRALSFEKIVHQQISYFDHPANSR